MFDEVALRDEREERAGSLLDFGVHALELPEDGLARLGVLLGEAVEDLAHPREQVHAQLERAVLRVVEAASSWIRASTRASRCVARSRLRNSSSAAHAA